MLQDKIHPPLYDINESNSEDERERFPLNPPSQPSPLKKTISKISVQQTSEVCQLIAQAENPQQTGPQAAHPGGRRRLAPNFPVVGGGCPTGKKACVFSKKTHDACVMRFMRILAYPAPTAGRYFYGVLCAVRLARHRGTSMTLRTARHRSTFQQ